jgi:hypothetical protein
MDLVVKAPPVTLWIGPALICALCYALYNIFIKKGSNSIHPVLGGVILQLVAALLGGVLLSILIAKEGPEEMNYDREGVQWAICAGLAVGSAEVSREDQAALLRQGYKTFYLKHDVASHTDIVIYCIWHGCTSYAKYTYNYWGLSFVWYSTWLECFA